MNGPDHDFTDWDAPGRLSIVVQGGIFRGNLVEIANHLGHWRRMFAHAEIILSISITDVLVFAKRDTLADEMELVPALAHDGHLQQAVTEIVQICDHVALASPALPLPPIKRDSPKVNNTNLLISAARCGLAMARGEYVLRVRSDLVFTNRNFLKQYAAAGRLPRSADSLFSERVLISWLYTLNPYTIERFPFHFSDWFNFGRLEDVRRLWDAPPVTLADAIHFKVNAPPSEANPAERLLNIRLAAEQHIAFACYAKARPSLSLDYHCDVRSRFASMCVLLDDFAICDLEQTGCYFEKYAEELDNDVRLFHCLTPEDWHALASLPTRSDEAFRRVLKSKIEAGLRHAAPPVGDTLPMLFTADHLRTKDSSVHEGSIVSDPGDATVFFGPYCTLRRGRYSAVVHLTSLSGTGQVSLDVTGDTGETRLALKRVDVATHVGTEMRVAFDLAAPVSDFEVVFRTHGDVRVAVRGLTIEARPPLLARLLGPAPAGSARARR